MDCAVVTILQAVSLSCWTHESVVWSYYRQFIIWFYCCYNSQWRKYILSLPMWTVSIKHRLAAYSLIHNDPYFVTSPISTLVQKKQIKMLRSFREGNIVAKKYIMW